MTLEEAIYETVHHSDMPLKAIADELDMSVSSLTRAGLPRNTESWASYPSHKISSLTHLTNKFLILDTLEQLVGRVAFPIPAAKSTADVMQNIMSTVKSFGKLIGNVQTSIADGVITTAEKDRIEKESYQMIQAVVALTQNIKQVSK